MAYEIPHDLIKQLQISLRNGARISSYDPHDPSLPNLPSLHETIAELNPSPPCLRCKHCRGRFLRDLKSFICVFCGREQSTEVPPDPINFKNTIACRWLLESFDLDGSEMVGPIDLKKSNRGKSPEQFPLTDILDLEIRWPETEKMGLSHDTSAPSKSTLNLAGVELDCYFSEGKNDSTSKASDELPLPNTQIDGSESKTIKDNVGLSLFGNVPSSEMTTRITKHDDSFSGWEASFQTAGPATSRDSSKSGFGLKNKSRSGEMEDTQGPSDNFRKGAFLNPNGISQEKATRPDAAFDVRRMSEENGETGENLEATKCQAASGTSSGSDNVHVTVAKMHELSFMLESNLSIPPK
ncbi:uncharacterized protein LOC111777238 isoform X2 [Cucurbita pepo subsp. pepo]|uniref:uncharacterized protein LOC111777238 isoform X2 n=1 Tax=Cucurbita pepo subsp. pepo TaxID=3664 RepID=UPI000C9D2ADB|nr:uncharacterized protein LOC111777238 isoform X2 [Cucurbita pepo subsp. pepo]